MTEEVRIMTQFINLFRSQLINGFVGKTLTEMILGGYFDESSHKMLTRMVRTLGGEKTLDNLEEIERGFRVQPQSPPRSSGM
jgi:hypothetical protein